jgi:ATP-binding cassette, subfamily F, member 3
VWPAAPSAHNNSTQGTMIQLTVAGETEAFINRFRAQATKSKHGVEPHQGVGEDRENRDPAGSESHSLQLFPQPKPSGRVVAEFKNVAKSYGDHLVFSDTDFIIERSDRVVLVGVNGAGKSTLIKILAGPNRSPLGSHSRPQRPARLLRAGQYKELDQNARMLDDPGTVVPHPVYG